MALSAISFRTLYLLAFLFSGLLCNPSFAGQVYDKNGKHWTILSTPESNSCSMVVGFDAGTMMYVGGERIERGTLFYFIFMRDKLSLEKDKAYKVEVRFPNNSVWEIEGIGSRADNLGGVYVRAVEGRFVKDFALNKMLSLKIDGVDYGDYDLSDSDTGILRLFDCIKSIKRINLPSR